QYDRHSITPNNVSVWGTLHKPMRPAATFDYGFGTELDANLSSQEKRFFPGELYAEGKAWFLVFTAGMKRAVYGNNDPVLSSGGMIWSRNSRPVPRLSIESDGYLKVPYTKGLLEVKGGLTHGWFTDSTVTKHTLLHYKYAGIRLGGAWPVRLNYTLHHVAQWAGESPQYGSSPADWDNFLRVLMGKGGGSSSPATEQYNTLGNHIISKNIGLEFDIRKATLELYWQNIYEDKPILPMYKTYNVEDGLFGLSLKMPTCKPLNRIVAEYMSTTDQSGPWHDLDGIIYGGQDGYYTNSVYPNGWSFYGMTIGNPWVTSPKYNADYTHGGVSMENNRLRLYYLAGMGAIQQTSYKAVFALSENYGATWSPTKRKQSFSWLLDTETPLRQLKQTTICAGISGDYGAMYGNNYAILVGLRWNGLLSW
ncbi:MAG: capsule assembly Wzi family protein, partial [Bacteroidota bacterium]|nr:capsule assembly Wzi family protein [Bacteroidota bacterium]